MYDSPRSAGKYHKEDTKKTQIARFIGSTWGRQDPGGPHAGLMNFVIREGCWEQLGDLTWDIIDPHITSYVTLTA